MKIIIIDDERLARQELANLLSEYAEVEIVDQCSNANDAIASIEKWNPDLIFLDGPGQFKVKGNINNITTTHKDIMPMSCDILKIEFYLVIPEDLLPDPNEGPPLAPLLF